jgi:hypothetical protein
MRKMCDRGYQNGEGLMNTWHSQRTHGATVARQIPAWNLLKVIRPNRVEFNALQSLFFLFLFSFLPIYTHDILFSSSFLLWRRILL